MALGIKQMYAVFVHTEFPDTKARDIAEYVKRWYKVAPVATRLAHVVELCALLVTGKHAEALEAVGRIWTQSLSEDAVIVCDNLNQQMPQGIIVSDMPRLRVVTTRQFYTKTTGDFLQTWKLS